MRSGEARSTPDGGEQHCQLMPRNAKHATHIPQRPACTGYMSTNTYASNVKKNHSTPSMHDSTASLTDRRRKQPELAETWGETAANLARIEEM
eukprot:477250-Rhodomonas_salina.1